MSLRYQKRINLKKGLGINLSKSGASVSQRTKFGSIGSRGFSIRTGIPGLYFRKSWGKGSSGLIVLLTIGILYVAAIVGYNLILFFIYLIKWIYSQLKTKK